mgnify:CR=1 FL=1
MLTDSLLYLPEDILVKTDRASMHSSLEVRSPFLDLDVIEYSWRIPLKMKINKGRGKYILRQITDKFVPKILTERPKHGFSAPISHWLWNGSFICYGPK